MKIVISLIVLLLVAALVGLVYYFISESENMQNAVETTKPPITTAVSPNMGIMEGAKDNEAAMKALMYEMKQNKDTVAWLRIPNTDINNSVIQSFNNVNYLRVTERKQPDTFGCYFSDYECSIGNRDVMSPNVIIYGHSDISKKEDQPDGKRFSQLFRFANTDFAKENPYLYFTTKEGHITYQIFSVMYVPSSFNYINPKLDETGIKNLASEAKLRSIYNYPVEVLPTDKILTLSTCSLKYGKNQRLVVMGVMLPEDTKEEKTVELAVNTNVKLPN